MPHNRAEQTAVGDDFVAVLEGAEHFRGFLLAALRGKNQQHIKNDHDDQQRRESHNAAGARALRHQRQTCM